MIHIETLHDHKLSFSMFALSPFYVLVLEPVRCQMSEKNLSHFMLKSNIKSCAKPLLKDPKQYIDSIQSFTPGTELR